MEISATQTAVMNTCTRKIEEQALELAEAIKINRDSNSKTHSSIKKLANNVVVALSQKLDRNDLRKVMAAQSHRSKTVDDQGNEFDEYGSRSSRQQHTNSRQASRPKSEFEAKLAEWRGEEKCSSGSGSGSDTYDPESRPSSANSQMSRRSRSF
jgi:vacuolar-type H+-ATPase subunit I/STV1